MIPQCPRGRKKDAALKAVFLPIVSQQLIRDGLSVKFELFFCVHIMRARALEIPLVIPVAGSVMSE